MKSLQKTHTPKVSILLPNLNNRRFLEERIQTVLDQTFTNWELVIVDSYSDDGAWELIQKFAKKDSRLRISQAPREGIYAGLNRCIRLARGEYVYIAPGDDTMAPDCLEKMVTAMAAHPECEICHTCLKAIDKEGKEIPGWWNNSIPVRFYGELMNKLHVRLAPYDGILHCVIQTVFISLTQLLIRRSIFEKIGLFRTDWNSVGDFEWGMRAALVCNILHIPEVLATWRIHSEQATAAVDFTSFILWAQWCKMIKAALPILKIYNPKFYKKISVHRLLLPYRHQQFIAGLQERHGWIRKMMFLFTFMFLSPTVVSDFVSSRVFGHQSKIDNFTYLRKELERLGLNQHVKILDEQSDYCY